jgi:predicted transporter
MGRVLITGFASLLIVALIAPAAQGATQVRQVQVEVSESGQIPLTPPGTLTLDFVF